MAVEDFTTYTEVDENSDITVAAGTITVSTMQRDATSYVKYSYPANTFGNFVHKFDFNWTEATSDAGTSVIWMVSNSSYTLQEGLNNAEGICGYLSFNNPNLYRYRFYNFATAVEDYIQWSSLPGVRYITVQRIGTTLTVMIYTDSGRTTLEDVLQITCANTAYANIIATASRDAAPTATQTMSYTVSNLDLQIVTTTGGTVSVGAGNGGVLAIPQRSSISPPQQAARKPYLSLKQSMKEFFSEHVRFIKSQNMKESVFEKPYRDYEYPSMHLSIPVPDWGGSSSRWWYRPGEWTPGPDPRGGGVPTKNCPGCALYADPIVGSCETDPVEIHSGIWCTDTPGAPTEGVTTVKSAVFNSEGQLNPQFTKFAGQDVIIDARPNGVVAGDTKLEIYTEGIGVIKDIAVGAWAFIGPSAAVYVDPDVPQHRVCGRMVDGSGSICYACVDVTCACDCDAAAPFLIDEANTDDTIAPGSSAIVTVSGGCTPITWNLSGNGYTLDKIITDGRANTIRSASTACGSSAGQYAAFVVVTATDDCGTSAVKNLRNTGGTWTSSYSTTEGACNVGGECLGTSVYTGTEIVRDNLKRWTNQCTTPMTPANCRVFTSRTAPAFGSCPTDTIQYSESGCGVDCWKASVYYYWTCGAC